MPGSVDRRTDLRDAVGDPGRGFVVDDTHRLDLVRAVGSQLFLDHGGINPVPPVAWYKFDVEAKPHRHRSPQTRELTGFEHQERSPGDKVFDSAASHAPVPEDG